MFVVWVRPFRPPHHEADVFVTGVGQDDAAALVRWFLDQGIEHELSPSSEGDDGELARPVGHLALEVPDLQDHQEPVLQCALQGGQRLLRHDRLDRAQNLPPPARPGPTNNNTMDDEKLQETATKAQKTKRNTGSLVRAGGVL